jgi:hypothetical protein
MINIPSLFALEPTGVCLYSIGMNWWVGSSILVVAGTVLRRLLRLNAVPVRRSRGFMPLSPDRERLYQSVSQEIETQCTIVGIALNDAIGERNSGNEDIAWRLVRLCASEWGRVHEIVTGLHSTLGKHSRDAAYSVPVRSMSAHHFKSDKMMDYFRMHVLLDQLVFRSRMRFQMQIRVLRRAVETLSREFNRTYAYADRTGYRSPELWSRLDLYYHDLDLLGKESLLALRAFLSCLPDSALPAFGDHLETVVKFREKPASVQVD